MRVGAIGALLVIGFVAACGSSAVDVDCGPMPQDDCARAVDHVIADVAKERPGAEIVRIEMQSPGVLVEYLDGSWTWTGLP